MRPPKHNSTKPHCFFNTARIRPWKPAAPMCRRKHRTPSDLISLHCARAATGVATETRISLPTTPYLTRWTSRSRPAATEPGLEPTVSGDLRPLCHPGGLRVFLRGCPKLLLTAQKEDSWSCVYKESQRQNWSNISTPTSRHFVNMGPEHSSPHPHRREQTVWNWFWLVLSNGIL